MNYNDITCNQFAGGISGYNQGGCVLYSGNVANISTVNEFAGGISGFSTDLNSGDLVIGYCYNIGKIEGVNCIGGICGGAWGNESKTIGIRNCYNTGAVTSSKTFNGGILGGTYFDYAVKKAENHNNIMFCYNIGIVNGNKINQIVSSYSSVTDCYYISGRTNNSGYGFGKAEYLFKAPISDNNSLINRFDAIRKGIWTLNSKYNNGYVCLLWQVK